MTSNTMTPEEAAELLRVNTHTVYRQLRAGKLPGGKVGSQWRLPRAEIEALLRGQPMINPTTKREG